MFLKSNIRYSIKTIASLSIALCTVQGASTQYEGDLSDVVTIDELDPSGPFNKIWEPHFAKWSDDHYICAYGLQVRGKVDMGDMVASISLDKGKTWSPRIMIFDHQERNGSVQYAYNNAVLFRPPGQDVIWLYAMRAPMHYRDSENADLVAAYTADGGYSWHHVELAMGYQGSLIIVAGIETVTTLKPQPSGPRATSPPPPGVAIVETWPSREMTRMR